MKILLAVLVLLALTAPACPQDCACGPECPCGPGCKCGLVSFNDRVAPALLVSTALIDPFQTTNRIANTFTHLVYKRALVENKVVVVGVNREVPQGDWITAQHEPDAFYRDGEVVIMKPNADRTQLIVVKRLGGITTQDVQAALQPPPMATIGYGACAGGSCGSNSFGAMPVGFGFRSGFMGGGCAGGR